MKNNKLKHRTSFLIVFPIIDLILLGMTLVFWNNAVIPEWLNASTQFFWIFIVAAAFVTMILSIIMCRSYETLRCILIESFLVMIYGFWIGIVRQSLFNDTSGNVYTLFAVASGCLLALMVLIQFDLLFSHSIRAFLTTDKKKSSQKRTESTRAASQVKNDRRKQQQKTSPANQNRHRTSQREQDNRSREKRRIELEDSLFSEQEETDSFFKITPSFAEQQEYCSANRSQATSNDDELFFITKK